MKYVINNFLITICVMLICTVALFAASDKQTGTGGASELLIPVGARSTALSGASIACVSGIDAMYWNPAGTSLLNSQAEAVISYNSYLADINVSYVAAVSNMGSVGNVGLSVKSLNFGDIIETTWDSPDGTGSVFSPNYLTVTLHYSRKFTDRIAFGINTKIISEKIMSASATGYGFDFGLQYINETGLKLGFVLSNFGSSMKFAGPDLEQRIQLSNTESGSTPSSVAIPAASFDLPTQLKIGASYDIAINEQNSVTVMGTFVNNSKALNQYIGGLEYTFNKMVFLRGAYSVALKEGTDGEDSKFVSSDEYYLWGPSFGGGVKLGIKDGMTVQFDYAYQLTEYFDNVQWFSFVFGM